MGLQGGICGEARVKGSGSCPNGRDCQPAILVNSDHHGGQHIHLHPLMSAGPEDDLIWTTTRYAKLRGSMAISGWKSTAPMLGHSGILHLLAMVLLLPFTVSLGWAIHAWILARTQGRLIVSETVPGESPAYSTSANTSPRRP